MSGIDRGLAVIIKFRKFRCIFSDISDCDIGASVHVPSFVFDINIQYNYSFSF